LRWENQKEGELRSIFPDYSPEWLLEQIQAVRRDYGMNDQKMGERCEEIFGMNKPDIPTYKEWQKKKKKKEELDKWSGAMSIKDMLELYEGDPAAYFYRAGRSEDKGVKNDLYHKHCKAGLLEVHRYHRADVIDREIKKAGGVFAVANRALSQMEKTRKTRRPDLECRGAAADASIEYLKEKKFTELETAIEGEKKRREAARLEMMERAREAGTLVECQCCYEETLGSELLPCKGGHVYCKECVNRGANVAIGDGKTIIQCLGQCEEEIGWKELQQALPPNVLSKLLERRQAEEVGAAAIDNLVTCPFCPYSTIMENDEDKLVVCRNPDCGRESCRLCKEPNHIPLRCDEVEKKDEEDARKKAEEHLTASIIRECANKNCGTKFMKEEGCNKMTCPKCMQKMCYLCKAPVKDYSHFYGQGGRPSEKQPCPLWSDNAALHAQEVAKAAQEAKDELAAKNVKLKHDPTAGIEAPAPKTTPEEVQSSLFNSWFELSGRVQQINNKMARQVLTDRMETLRQQISVATPDTEPGLTQGLACITNYVGHCNRNPAYVPPAQAQQVQQPQQLQQPDQIVRIPLGQQLGIHINLQGAAGNVFINGGPVGQGPPPAPAHVDPAPPAADPAGLLARDPQEEILQERERMRVLQWQERMRQHQREQARLQKHERERKRDAKRNKQP